MIIDFNIGYQFIFISIMWIFSMGGVSAIEGNYKLNDIGIIPIGYIYTSRGVFYFIHVTHI